MVGERGHPQPSLVEPAPRAVVVVVGDADDARAGVDEALRRAVVEALAVAEEDNGVAPAEAREGVGAVGGDRLGIAESPERPRGRVGGLVVAEAERLGKAGAGEHLGRPHRRPVVQLQLRGPAALRADATHAAAHAALDAVLAQAVDQGAQDDAHALERPAEALAVEGAPEDGELPQLDVALVRAAVVAGGQQEHLLEGGLAEALREPGAGHSRGRVERVLVHRAQLGIDRPEGVDAGGELAGDLGLEHREIIRHPQLAPAEHDAGAKLRGEVELLAADAELAEKLGQGRALGALGDPVRHRMQADVVFSAGLGVEGIESAGRVVALQQDHALAEHPQAQGRRQAGHAGADDGDVVGGLGHGETEGGLRTLRKLGVLRRMRG